METSILSLNDQVDLVLNRIANSPTLTLDLEELYDVTIMNENAYQLDHLLLEKGLIRLSNNARAITSKGLEISNFGGWIAYQKQFGKEKPKAIISAEVQQKQFEREIKNLRLEVQKLKEEIKSRAEKETTLMATVRNLIEQNNSRKVILILTGILAGILCSSAIWVFIF